MASGLRLSGSELRLCHLLCALGQVTETLLPQFPHLSGEDNNSNYFAGKLGVMTPNNFLIIII